MIAGAQEQPRAQAASEVLADRVRAFREYRGWSLRELSRRLEAIGHRLDASSISRIEQGSRSVSVDEWLHLATVLGIPPLDLIGENRRMVHVRDDLYEAEVAAQIAQAEALARIADRLDAITEQHALTVVAEVSS